LPVDVTIAELVPNPNGSSFDVPATDSLGVPLTGATRNAMNFALLTNGWYGR
jgi:hypothetical protein